MFGPNKEGKQLDIQTIEIENNIPLQNEKKMNLIMKHLGQVLSTDVLT